MKFSKYRNGERDSASLTFSHTLEEVPNPRHFKRHCHDGYELIYVVKGEGSYVVEGEKYKLHPHSLLLLPPHAFHHVEVNNAKPYERFVVNFKETAVPSDIRAVLQRLYDDGNLYGRFYRGDSIPLSVVQSLAAMQEVDLLSGAEANGYVTYLLSSVILRLSINEALVHCEDRKVLGARVIRYLNSHITENISLEELAHRFFVSKFHLCRAFKEHNGVSVLQYITEKRVMHAKHLMELGETAVSAASKAGFGDYSSFYRAHRRVCGVAPRKDKKPVSYTYGTKGDEIGHE